MTRTALKMNFYVTAGTILASISWGAIEHSVVTGDYILAVFVMGMMFFIIGKFFVDRCDPFTGQMPFTQIAYGIFPKRRCAANCGIGLGSAP